MKPAISFENVSKTYTLYHSVTGIKNFLFRFRKALKELRESQFQALQDISFSIQPGERVGFIGPNGAGKSTILGMIAGVITPNSGTLQVKGRISPLLELGAGFHFELTGIENIYLNAILLGMRKKEVEKKLDAIIEFSELGQFIDQPIRTYSSGMMARLGFSVAVHVDPEILLIDEILSVGDIHFQKKSFDKIMEFQEKGVTIVLVSHNPESIEKVCNRVIWLEKGRVVEMGDDVPGILERYEKRAVG